MYAWTDPYEDETIKECIEELMVAQKNAEERGCLLLSSYEHFWLPVLHELQSLFANEVVVSNSPMGYQSVPSAPLPVPNCPR